MSKYKFVKVGNRYLVKNSNGRIVDEKTMLKMKNDELALEDIKSNGCQGKITKEISKNKKRIKEIEENDLDKISKDDKLVKATQNELALEVAKKALETALEEKEDADDIIKETDTTL